jgi:hypothetical protein
MLQSPANRWLRPSGSAAGPMPRSGTGPSSGPTDSALTFVLLAAEGLLTVVLPLAFLRLPTATATTPYWPTGMM